MSGREWAFLIDENLEPKIAVNLRKEGYQAEHVQNAMGKGVDDMPDVLPYARKHDRIVVTADVKDFAPLPDSEHRGLMLLDNQQTSAYRVTNSILDIIEAYGDCEAFDKQKLDAWI